MGKTDVKEMEFSETTKLIIVLAISLAMKILKYIRTYYTHFADLLHHIGREFTVTIKEQSNLVRSVIGNLIPI